jgi:ABC-type multidrug transport system permease subunit
MSNLTTNNSMDGNQNYDSIGSVFFGFIFAVTNHLFGFMNNINITAHWDAWFQAIVTGGLGAFAAFFVNKGLKKLEKRFKKT